MRRIFIFLSTLFLSFFMLFMLWQQYPQVVFSSYPSVDLIGSVDTGTVIDREQVYTTLEKLAKDENSLIARRIVEPNQKGEMIFTYATYGEGTLPDGLMLASDKSSEDSDLVSSYLIVSGNLHLSQLEEIFRSLGYQAQSFSRASLVDLVFSLILNDISVPSLGLAILSFFSLSVIQHILKIRSAALKFVSGKVVTRIMWESVAEDFRLFLSSFLVSTLLGCFVILWLGLWHQTILLYEISIGLYLLLLGVVSIVVSLTYLLALQVNSLVSVLKGRLPLRRLLSLMLLSQFLAFLTIGWSFSTIMQEYQKYQLLEAGKSSWERKQNFYSLSYSFSSAFTKGEEQEKQSKAWYSFAIKSIESEKAVFVKHNLRQFLTTNVADGINVNSPDPGGHALFISQNYLELENVQVPEEFKQKMKNLKEGEFGLVLPKFLASSQEELEEQFTNFMANFAAETLDISSKRRFEAKAYTTLTSDGENRFLYSVDSDIPMQFLLDPIPVIISPIAMGDTPNSRLFWESEIGNGLHLEGYQESEELLKQEGVYNWVSSLSNNWRMYLQNLSTSRTRLTVLLVGVVLGLGTSALLFNAMVMLYFEQYRKEIFIKRLSGLSFEEIHFNFMLVEFLMLGLGLASLIYLSRHIFLSLMVAFVFVLNLFLILGIQSRRERKVAVSVLKGG
ncbi:DUF1430 domain-containing protein [Streptococcus sp. 10F2]